MLLIHVDDNLLDRLQQLAVLILLVHNLRTRHPQLEAFAAHGFNQNAELQFAAARDNIRIRACRFLDFKGHIAFRFRKQAGADHTAGDLIPLCAREGRVIDHKCHRQGGRINRLRLQGLRHVRRAQRIRHVELG